MEEHLVLARRHEGEAAAALPMAIVVAVRAEVSACEAEGTAPPAELDVAAACRQMCHDFEAADAQRARDASLAAAALPARVSLAVSDEFARRNGRPPSSDAEAVSLLRELVPEGAGLLKHGAALPPLLLATAEAEYHRQQGTPPPDAAGALQALSSALAGQRAAELVEALATPLQASPPALPASRPPWWCDGCPR